MLIERPTEGAGRTGRTRTDCWFACLLSIVGCLVACGCDDGRPERVPVSGTVTIDGKPLQTGYVQVVPDNARAATGRIRSDGCFKLTCYGNEDGCVLGTYRVAVSGCEMVGENAQRWYAPKRYADASTSGLTVTIKEPTDSLNIELTWDGGKPFVEKF